MLELFLGWCRGCSGFLVGRWAGGLGHFCLLSRYFFVFLTKTLCEVMFLISIGSVFQIVMYFVVRWVVVCFGVRVFEYWYVFGMYR